MSPLTARLPLTRAFNTVTSPIVNFDVNQNVREAIRSIDFAYPRVSKSNIASMNADLATLKVEADTMTHPAQGLQAGEVITIGSDDEDDSGPLTPPDSTCSRSPHSPRRVEGPRSKQQIGNWAQPASTNEGPPISSCPEEARSTSQEVTSNLPEAKTVASPAPRQALQLASPKPTANVDDASSEDENDLRSALRRGKPSGIGPVKREATDIEESTDDDNDLVAAIRATQFKVAPPPRVPPQTRNIDRFSDDIFRTALEKNYTRMITGKQKNLVDLAKSRKRAAPEDAPLPYLQSDKHNRVERSDGHRAKKVKKNEQPPSPVRTPPGEANEDEATFRAFADQRKPKDGMRILSPNASMEMGRAQMQSQLVSKLARSVKQGRFRGTGAYKPGSGPINRYGSKAPRIQDIAQTGSIACGNPSLKENTARNERLTVKHVDPVVHGSCGPRHHRSERQPPNRGPSLIELADKDGTFPL